MVYKSGMVAIVGRPNVGKSTLLNHCLGQKLSITSRKPQTTRHQIMGIYSAENGQIVFIDTPGMHQRQGRALNRYMNKAATASLLGVDLVVWVVDANNYTDDDDWILQKIKNADLPCILVLNKIDNLADKTQLLPKIEGYLKRYPFQEIVPISALKSENIEVLLDTILEHLEEGAPIFPEDQLTDKSERFLAAEIVREKLTRSLGQELPYALTVAIEQFKEEKKCLHIGTVIWVERDSQKAIVIGKQGRRLKQVGQDARLDMEKLFAQKVMLQLWVKVKSGWSDDENLLPQFGYHE